MSCMLLWKRVNLSHFQIIGHSLPKESEKLRKKDGKGRFIFRLKARALGKNNEVRGYTSLKCYFGLIVILAD